VVSNAIKALRTASALAYEQEEEALQKLSNLANTLTARLSENAASADFLLQLQTELELAVLYYPKLTTQSVLDPYRLQSGNQ
jgi:hypothetical protein